MKVGYLGPEGTFSHAALLASDWPPGDAEPVPCESEREAVLGVATGELDASLVPVENAIEGGVNATIDTLIHEAPGVVVTAEELLPVSHALLAGDGIAITGITEIVSHAQPLAQCRTTLARLLPGRPVRAVSSTAEAVRQVLASGAPIAAIAPESAAETYGAVVLERGLEDVTGNATRFWWVAPPTATSDENSSCHMKTSVVLDGQGDTEPGWLHSCLGVFADRDLNLCRIESRPSREHLGHYLFLIDIEGAAASEPLSTALTTLDQRGVGVRVLGSYPAAGPPAR